MQNHHADGSTCSSPHTWEMKAAQTHLYSLQLLSSSRHPDDAWKKLADLQKTAQDDHAADLKTGTASDATAAAPAENGVGEAPSLDHKCMQACLPFWCDAEFILLTSSYVRRIVMRVTYSKSAEGTAATCR